MRTRRRECYLWRWLVNIEDLSSSRYKPWTKSTRVRNGRVEYAYPGFRGEATDSFRGQMMTGTRRSWNSPRLDESQKRSQIPGFGLWVWTRAAEKVCPAMKDMREGMRKFGGRGEFWAQIKPDVKAGSNRDRTGEINSTLFSARHGGHGYRNALHRSQDCHRPARPRRHGLAAQPQFPQRLLRGFRHPAPGFPVSLPLRVRVRNSPRYLVHSEKERAHEGAVSWYPPLPW